MGHKIEYTAYDTGILPQQTITAVTKAISDKPTIIIGLQVSSASKAAGQLPQAVRDPDHPGKHRTTPPTSASSACPTMFRISDTAKERGGLDREVHPDLHPSLLGRASGTTATPTGRPSTTSVGPQLQAAGITKLIKRESLRVPPT